MGEGYRTGGRAGEHGERRSGHHLDLTVVEVGPGGRDVPRETAYQVPEPAGGRHPVAAAKAGVIGLAKSLAIEGARAGVRVNAIAPMASTAMTRDVFDARLHAALTPESVSPVALALLHRSCPLTGEVVETGGGWASVLRWERSDGIRPGPGGLDAETAAAHWTALTRFDSGADHPATTADALAAALSKEPTS